MAGIVASAPFALESLIALPFLCICPFLHFFSEYLYLAVQEPGQSMAAEHTCAGTASGAAQERSAFLAGLWSFTLKWDSV